MNGRYILDEQGEPVSEDDLLKWARVFERSDRIVAKETIGDSEVSTVFLGLDHACAHDSFPVLWETMVFGGPLDQEQDRCGGKRVDALAMHQRMVERVKHTPQVPA